MTDEQFEKLLEAVRAITEHEPGVHTSLLDVFTQLQKMTDHIDELKDELSSTRGEVENILKAIDNEV